MNLSTKIITIFVAVIMAVGTGFYLGMKTQAVRDANLSKCSDTYNRAMAVYRIAYQQGSFDAINWSTMRVLGYEGDFAPREKFLEPTSADHNLLDPPDSVISQYFGQDAGT